MDMKPGIYRHFKGNLYELLLVGKHSENGEEMAVYKALDAAGAVWVRPLSMWNENVRCDSKIVPCLHGKGFPIGWS